jgi:hypothetical protein
MTDPPTPSAHDTAAEPTDLYCPQCEYNLHGIDSARCPECGTAIDYEALAQVCTLEPRSLRLALCPTSSSWFDAIWRIWLLAFFRPGILVQRIPYRCHLGEVYAYSFATKAIAALLAILFLETRYTGEEWIASLVQIPFVGASPLICEEVLAIVLGLTVRPHGMPGSPKIAFWRVATHMMTCFLLITTLFSHCGYWLMMSFEGAVFDLSANLQIFLYFLIYGGPFLWWWVALNRMIYARGVGQRLIAVIAIPIICVIILYISAIAVALTSALAYYLFQ